ncbi:proteasome assembly chaperone family protein [Candidatus Bathyarchaeota archaeon]|nr:proteasome assembly chaperone family protein [Candidatus Bathyarchaeota archaeon]
MKETLIKEIKRVELKNPILIEGLPGLGLVGRITTRYLIKQLKAEKIAYLYSPHFPYYVLVGKKGSVRLPRGVFYAWKNESGANDLMFFTGDCQAQTIEGQYEVSNSILEFAKKHNVKTIITVGGYRMEVKDKPKVFAAATNQNLLKMALEAGANVSSVGNPIVGAAGLILGLAPFKNVEALCLLGETRGYLPDPQAAKSVLEVLFKLLNFSVDLADLEKEIVKAEKIIDRLKKVEEKRVLQAEEIKKERDKRITYIS